MYSLDTFYRCKDWIKFRDVVIAERLTAEGMTLCEHCGKPILKAYDIILHHVQELTEENVNDVSVSLNPANIMLVHHRCHNKIHHKLSTCHNVTRKVYLVYGSPLSGKSTYVESIKVEGDLILDMDSIWQCISGCERYTKPKELTSIAFGVRDQILQSIKYRQGRWHTAYVIGGYPLISERERLCKELGAEEVFVDTSKEECLKRLFDLSDEDKRANDIWQKYIFDWWERYTPPLQGSSGAEGNC